MQADCKDDPILRIAYNYSGAEIFPNSYLYSVIRRGGTEMEPTLEYSGNATSFVLPLLQLRSYYRFRVQARHFSGSWSEMSLLSNWIFTGKSRQGFSTMQRGPEPVVMPDNRSVPQVRPVASGAPQVVTPSACGSNGTVGGTGNGAPCVLPFTFQAVNYTTCTDALHGSPWCYTTRAFTEWGECVIGTVRGNAGGRPCQFPFVHNMQTYTGCTTVDSNVSWCYTTDPALWGECDFSCGSAADGSGAGGGAVGGGAAGGGANTLTLSVEAGKKTS